MNIKQNSTKILFVCLGNICRSPTAHGIFQGLVAQADLADRITVDSAGTGDWHIGLPPDSRMTASAKDRGYDLSSLRARQISIADFYQFDLILAMDNSNLADLQAMQPSAGKAKLALFLDYAATAIKEVPDPYYGPAEGFETVLDLVEDGGRGLLAALRTMTAA